MRVSSCRMSSRMNARVSLGHPLHLVQRGDDLRPRPFVVDELGVKAQARDRGPEVVRYRREHCRAVPHEAVESFAHEVEGLHGAAHFHGAGFRQVAHLLAPPEPVGRVREALHGFRDPPPHQDGHHGHAESRKHEREQESPAPTAARPAAAPTATFSQRPSPMSTDAVNQWRRQRFGP